MLELGAPAPTDDLVIFVGVPLAVAVAVATATGYYFKKKSQKKPRAPDQPG